MKKENFPDVFSSENVVEKNFSDKESIRQGSFTTVFPFEYVPSKEMHDEFEIDEKEYVLKRYDFHDIVKTVFPKEFQDWSLQEKAKFLKERQFRTNIFFQDIPGLTVLSSSFFVHSKSGQEDGKMYEMQKRKEGQNIGQLFDENSLEWFLGCLGFEEKETLKKSIELIIKHFGDAILRKEIYVPDTNPYNFIIDKKGNITLIDTNIEFDWSQNSGDEEAIFKIQKNNLEYFETVLAALNLDWI